MFESWISGTFAFVKHKDYGTDAPWVGGARQTVYFGRSVRTYQFTGTKKITGLWAVINGDFSNPHPIPTSQAIVEASGSWVVIELQSTDNSYVSEGRWIDVPTHPNVGCGGNAVSRILSDSVTSVDIHNGPSARVFRFTSQDSPSGLWVRTDFGDDQPIPIEQAPDEDQRTKPQSTWKVRKSVSCSKPPWEQTIPELFVG